MNRTVELAQNLVKIPSVSGEEKDIRDFITSIFDKEGIQTIEQQGNLLVHLEGADHTRALIFNSHMDVVPVKDKDGEIWTENPWGGEIKNGLLYGKGSSDMKSGMAAATETIIRLSHRTSLPTDVWLTLVQFEEVDGRGTRWFAEWFKNNGYTSRYQEIAAIFTEPTMLQFAEYGHRGNYFLTAEKTGPGGHSGHPKDAPYFPTDIIDKFSLALRGLSDTWDTMYPSDIFSPPSIVKTGCWAGSPESPNSIPERSVATFDLRTVPGFHEDAYIQVQKLAEEHGVSIRETVPNAPFGLSPIDSPIIKAMQSILPDLELKTSDGSADLGFVTGFGTKGVIFGPGNNKLAHKADEWSPVDQIELAPKLFTKFYDAWALMKE
jgi:acetylornithine deacetylase/succinyl-diaminopimelate desuccinylase-like protein